MKQGILISGLVAGCVVLGVLCVTTVIAQDKVPPTISIENTELTYTEGDDYSTLLNGVSAEDNRDGDLTAKLFVDSVMPLEGTNEAVVRYAVIDSAGNVKTETRKVQYVAGNSGESNNPNQDEIGNVINQEETSNIVT